MSNLILSNFYQCNNSVLLQLFKCYERPILEYGSVIFSPHYVYLVELIEHVQHNFTKRLHGLNDVSYVNRLHICKLESLELRRIHSYLIFVFKILNGLVDVNIVNNLNTSHIVNRCTSGNNCKLVKYRFNLDVRKFFFVNRIVTMWNLLGDDIICSRNVQMLVNKLRNVDFTSFFKGHTYK